MDDWRRQYRRLRTVQSLAAAYWGDQRVPFEAWQPLLDHADGSTYLELLRGYATHEAMSTPGSSSPAGSAKRTGTTAAQVAGCTGA